MNRQSALNGAIKIATVKWTEAKVYVTFGAL